MTTLAARVEAARRIATGRTPIFYGWWIVAAGFGTHTINGALLFHAFGTYVVLLGDDFGWSRDRPRRRLRDAAHRERAARPGAGLDDRQLGTAARDDRGDADLRRRLHPAQPHRLARGLLHRLPRDRGRLQPGHAPRRDGGGGALVPSPPRVGAGAADDGHRRGRADAAGRRPGAGGVRLAQRRLRLRADHHRRRRPARRRCAPPPRGSRLPDRRRPAARRDRRRRSGIRRTARGVQLHRTAGAAHPRVLVPRLRARDGGAGDRLNLRALPGVLERLARLHAQRGCVRDPGDDRVDP